MPSSLSPADQIKEVWTSDDGTAAKDTATVRWPRIVQDMVDDVRDTAEQMRDGPQKAEAPAIQRALKQMKDEMRNNEALPALRSDGGADIEGYNEQLARWGECSWLACPWLFGECYLYRRVQAIISTSKHWQTYDVFQRKKDSTFVKSQAAVEELSARYMNTIADPDLSKEVTGEAAKVLFSEMTEIALWGNATDLSLLAQLSLEDIQLLQGRKSIAKSQRNIVDNDTEAVYAYLTDPARPPNRRIDIVLDNAGFELFTDLLYASYLLESGLASTVTLHAKEFPWFVSDVTPADMDALFSHLAPSSSNNTTFPHRADIDPLLRRIRRQFDSGALGVTQHPFWTTAYTYHEMPRQAPDLWEDLKGSGLVVFKGDLNYRKLTKDGLWPHTTPFRDALGPLGEANGGLKVLALRTNKADVCVGVDGQAKVDALDEEAPNGAWVRNGKYAVISFCDGQ